MYGRALLLTLASLALATPAQAATYAGHVSVRSWLEGDFDIREDYRYTVRQLRYDGDPGAASNVSVRFRSAGRAVISDPRGVQARGGCVQRGRTRVECRARGRAPGSDPAALFVLGDGDDVLRMRGISKNAATLVRAGEGDDDVAGSPASDLIYGGAGRRQAARPRRIRQLPRRFRARRGGQDLRRRRDRRGRLLGSHGRGACGPGG